MIPKIPKLNLRFVSKLGNYYYHFMCSNSNKNFCLLTIAIGMVFGNFDTFEVIISWIINPFRYDDTSIGNLGAPNIVGGLIGGAVSGIYVEKTLKYKKTLVILSLLSLFAYISLFATYNTKNGILTGILVFIYLYMWFLWF